MKKTRTASTLPPVPTTFAGEHKLKSVEEEEEPTQENVELQRQEHSSQQVPNRQTRASSKIQCAASQKVENEDEPEAEEAEANQSTGQEELEPTPHNKRLLL